MGMLTSKQASESSVQPPFDATFDDA